MRVSHVLPTRASSIDSVPSSSIQPMIWTAQASNSDSIGRLLMSIENCRAWTSSWATTEAKNSSVPPSQMSGAITISPPPAGSTKNSPMMITSRSSPEPGLRMRTPPSRTKAIRGRQAGTRSMTAKAASRRASRSDETAPDSAETSPNPSRARARTAEAGILHIPNRIGPPPPERRGP